LVVRRFIK